MRIFAGNLFPFFRRKLFHLLFVDMVQPHLEVLLVFPGHGFKEHAREQGYQRRQNDEAGDDQRREFRHKTGLIELNQYGNQEDNAENREGRRQNAEEFHRSVCTEQPEDGTDDLEAVGIGVQLADASLRAVAVLDQLVFDEHVLVSRVNAHLGLDLEALGQNREGLNEFIAEGPVTSHDVLDIHLEQMID